MFYKFILTKRFIRHCTEREWPRTLDVLGVIARSSIRTDAASYQNYDMACSMSRYIAW